MRNKFSSIKSFQEIDIHFHNCNESITIKIIMDHQRFFETFNIREYVAIPYEKQGDYIRTCNYYPKDKPVIFTIPLKENSPLPRVMDHAYGIIFSYDTPKKIFIKFNEDKFTFDTESLRRENVRWENENSAGWTSIMLILPISPINIYMLPFTPIEISFGKEEGGRTNFFRDIKDAPDGNNFYARLVCIGTIKGEEFFQDLVNGILNFTPEKIRYIQTQGIINFTSQKRDYSMMGDGSLTKGVR